jgi:hypothetical protein
MLLTEKQIRRLLDELGYMTVFEETGPNGVRVQRKHGGYSQDDEVIGIQGKLSIMLEAKARVGAE